MMEGLAERKATLGGYMSIELGNRHSKFSNRHYIFTFTFMQTLLSKAVYSAFRLYNFCQYLRQMELGNEN